MIEIFQDIPLIVKENAEAVFRLALMQDSISSAAKILDNYVNSCTNEEEREFVNFYFQLKFEEMNNGNFTN